MDMDTKAIKKYFEENAVTWLSDAYATSDYTYPVGLHRTRIVMRTLVERFGSQRPNLLDIGCGGGDLCFLEAEAGYQATGVDQSATMISSAQDRWRVLPDERRSGLKFIHAELGVLRNTLPQGTYDAVTTMGVIYYLPEDDEMLQCAWDLLKPGGLLAVSCRNRLFNMFGAGEYTDKEIERGSAAELLKQIQKLYHPIADATSALFADRLEEAICRTRADRARASRQTSSGAETKRGGVTPGYTFDVVGRQHTPSDLIASAAKFGFTHIGFYGVHPHLLAPALNSRLPPQMFNQLSDALCAFEDLPISLTWSSQFIGLFEKSRALGTDATRAQS